MNRAAISFALLTVACSTRAPSRAVEVPPDRLTTDRIIRVALALSPQPSVGATEELRWHEWDGRTIIARGRAGEAWRVERERDGTRVRAVRPDGVPTVWQRALVARTSEAGFVTVNGRRYRGEIYVVAQDTTLLVINRLPIEQYLRGVVPAELGNRARGDSAALQAQAVASRSFAHMRLATTDDRAFDVRSTTADQVYAGADVENDGGNAAVAATRGLVLRHQGRTVDAPYHSTCGGSTAEASEVWRSPGAAHLRRVSDRVGRGDRYYCDIAPRYRWTRSLSGDELNAALQRYLKLYASVPGGNPGTARELTIRTRTASGRVAVLDVETDRGMFAVRGDEIRYVLRTTGGEILSSTYFSVEPQYGRGGGMTRVTLRGQGYGHGVGLCQWGAIGRARSGQTFRQILGTYYPGTTIGPAQ